MTFNWRILTLMPKKHRKEFIQQYLQGDDFNLKNFLIAGNDQGVFTLADMQEFHADFNGASPEDQDHYQENWTASRDQSEALKRVMVQSYGGVNFTNEMLTVGNILKTLAKANFYVTIGANAFIGLWKNEKLRSPEGMLKIIADPNVVMSAVGLGAIYAYENRDREGKYTEGDAVKEYRALRNTGSEKAWDAFLLQDDRAGAMALAEFTRTFPEDKALPTDKFTSKAFEKFLANKETKKASTSQVDYTKVLADFKKALKAGPEPDKMFRSYGRVIRELHLDQDGKHGEALTRIQKL